MLMAQHVRGIDVKIKVNTGTDQSPVWTVVAGQQGAKLKDQVETIEITSKDSGNYKEFEYGFGEWQIECEGLVVVNDDGFEALRDAMRNHTKVKVEWYEAGGKTYEGMALVTEIPLEAAFDEMLKYQVHLKGTGAYTLADSV